MNRHHHREERSGEAIQGRRGLDVQMDCFVSLAMTD
jgi:hypothetical protein